MPSRVIITGASGVLGSAVRKAFLEASNRRFEVLALAHSRSGEGLVKVDLTDKDITARTFQEFKPDWVIHCAAERRPDIAERDPEGARILNAEVPAHLAFLSRALKFTLVYICLLRLCL